MEQEERIKSMSKKQLLEYAISNALKECNSKFKKHGNELRVSKISSPQTEVIAAYDSNGSKLDDSYLERCVNAEFVSNVNLTIVLADDDMLECPEKISSNFVDVKYDGNYFTGKIAENVSVM